MLEKRKSKHNQSKNRKGRRHIYQIVEEHGEQISSLNAKMSEISTLSTHVSDLMSVVSANWGYLQLPWRHDINKDKDNDDIRAKSGLQSLYQICTKDT